MGALFGRGESLIHVDDLRGSILCGSVIGFGIFRGKFGIVCGLICVVYAGHAHAGVERCAFGTGIEDGNASRVRGDIGQFVRVTVRSFRTLSTVGFVSFCGVGGGTVRISIFRRYILDRRFFTGQIDVVCVGQCRALLRGNRGIFSRSGRCVCGRGSGRLVTVAVGMENVVELGDGQVDFRWNPAVGRRIVTGGISR